MTTMLKVKSFFDVDFVVVVVDDFEKDVERNYRDFEDEKKHVRR